MGSKNTTKATQGKRTRKDLKVEAKKKGGNDVEMKNNLEKETVLKEDEEEGNDQDSSDDGSSEMTDDEENNVEQEDEDDFPRKKKSKNSKHDDGSAGFSTAFNAILSSHLKAYDRKDPIMARNKKVLKQSESEKLEYKAKKAMLAEKKKLLSKARKQDIIPLASGEDKSENIRKVLEKETALRKIAQKGAVKLFNAILSTQVKTEKEVTENLSGIKNKEEKRELITEVSKEKFLDLVKAAAGSDNE
ncbi:YPR143W [Saccharomyces arboricola H-6]|uniref:YPR143W n=1 Tax=Saccharomyces arboricola (strain H-6 / AS 2.3317 / CBS 10644) TaxID=1160507 RepID=J8PV98_SACAR|nr:YPR143W [Saccharomyces arboricola H-6]